MCFNDFGDSFVVTDRNGEEPLTGMIANISHDTDGVVACLDEQRHGLQDGDLVKFTEINGMVELNSTTPKQIVVTGS